ncbi:MAG TPA: ChaN family lipoprotein [Prolixibacteraceae bacterium]
MVKQYLVLMIGLLLVCSFKSDKPAYVLFNAEGREIHYHQLLEQAREADVILFGELHNNPIVHWLEQELTRDLYADKKDKLILGAEMFESDDQIIVDEYLAGLISEKTMNDEGKLWTNYPSDYKPLLDMAKENKLRFVATNIPRRYASMVYAKGLEVLDSIHPEAKKWIAPLPIAYDSTLSCYRDIFKQAQGHGGENLPKSQAVKDATMAWFILQNWSSGKTLIHFNGSYHSDHHQGIEWYLKRANPKLKVMTIGATEQDTIDELDQESKGLADCIVCTPSSMSKSYRP